MEKPQKHRMPLPDPAVKPTVTVEEVVQAGWLSISRRTLYRAIEAGEVPSLRFQHKIVIPTSALRRLVLGETDTLVVAERSVP
jgi:hypothetical protein